MSAFPIGFRALVVAASLLSFGSIAHVVIATADEGIDRPQIPEPHYPRRPATQYQTQSITTVGPTPSIYVQWQGASDAGCRAGNPPDPHGAAGPAGLILTVNYSVSYTGRDGFSRWASNNTVFMAPSGALGAMLDYKSLYDSQSGRFYVVGSEYFGVNNVYYYYTVIAVSKTSDPTASDTSSWYFYRINTSQTAGAIVYGGDYPCLGVDHQCLYVTLNMFSLPIGGSSSFRNVQIVSLDKSSLNSGTAVYTRLNTPNTPGDWGGGFTLQPVSLVGSTTAGNVGYFAEIPYFDDMNVRLWAVSDPLGTPTLSSTLISIPSNGGGFGGSGAPQAAPGDALTNQHLDTVSPRAMGNAFWRQGDLWFCCTAGNTITPQHASVFYYRLATNSYPSGTPTLGTSGILDGGAGVWRFVPSIAGNAAGDVCLTFTQSSSTTYPTVMATVQQAGSDGFPDPVAILTSPSYFNGMETPNILTCNFVPSYLGRWGDYSVATVDPLDNSFWVADEFANGSQPNQWGVRWANLFFGASTAWQTDGASVRSGTTASRSARIIPDGSGGTFVAWVDLRLHEATPFIKRLTSTGNTVSGWPTAGLLVSSTKTLYGNDGPSLVSDGSGGAYVSYVTGSASTKENTYLQHVTSSGGIASGWPSPGVDVDYTLATDLIADGLGGVIIGWSDTNGDVRVQRYDASDTPAWAIGGVVLGSEADNVAVVSDGHGGAIVVWGPTLSAQRISSSGTLLWTTGGVSLDAAALSVVAAADESGGAFIGYQRDSAGTTTDPMYALHITSSGANASGWPVGGRPCTQIVYNQSQPAIASDGAGGGVIVWKDQRSSPTQNIYAQRFTGTGGYAAGWSSNGVAVCTASGVQSRPALIADSAGGALFTWDDSRGTFWQHILGSGARDLTFTPNGDSVCTAAGDQRIPVLALASTRTAVLSWADGRNCGTGCTTAIYAQQQLFDSGAPVDVANSAVTSIGKFSPPYPNPARGATRLQISIPSSVQGAKLLVGVFDLAGRRVRSLVDEVATPGPLQVDWNLLDDSGARVAPALYMVRVNIGATRRVFPLVVVH